MKVVHPRLERWEFEALQEKFGWEAPLEYLDGQAVVTPPVGGDHSDAHLECIGAIRDWMRETGDGGRVGLDVFVLVGDDQLAPDLSYWRAERRPGRTPGRINSAPDLVVEVASPSTEANDQGPKRRSYLAAGVREQWLIDPVTRRIGAVDAAGRMTSLGPEERLVSAVLAGFSVLAGTLLGG